jgi:hypothetical protein
MLWCKYYFPSYVCVYAKVFSPNVKKTAYYLVWTKETIRIGYKNNPSLPTTLVQIICNNKWFSIARLIH